MLFVYYYFIAFAPLILINMIELRTNHGISILLSPVKQDEKEGTYLLIDSHNKSWMEVVLNKNSFSVLSKNSEIEEPDDDLQIKLDQLVLQVVEAEQAGTESTDIPLQEGISPYDPEKIKIHSKAFNLRLISDMIDEGDIDLSPDFQRNFVWDSIRKSRLIESILLRIPLPMFYFSEDEEGRITVVDGLQRLTTIKDFMDNKFALKDLEYLGNSCNGRYYSDKDKQGNPTGKKAIDPKYFRWFNQTQFSVNVIDPSSPYKVKYDIFRRINTGGRELNRQEIRNCLSSSALRQTLRDMTLLAEFKSATSYSIKPTRMEDHEMALRFICFYQLYQQNTTLNNYSGYMDAMLDTMTEELGRLPETVLNENVRLFSNAMQNAEYLFGGKYAFRKMIPTLITSDARKQLINKALFVSCSVLLSNYNPQQVQEKNKKSALLLPLANAIESDPEFMAYLSYGTNGKANLQHVFHKIETLIQEHLNH